LLQPAPDTGFIGHILLAKQLFEYPFFGLDLELGHVEPKSGDKGQRIKVGQEQAPADQNERVGAI